MKALEHDRYGSPDVLEYRDVASPEPHADGVVVRVHAAAVNPLDWHLMTGTPYFLRLTAGLRQPKGRRRGVDMAGTVESVGSSVTEFEVGDEVFGGGQGAFAEYVACRVATLAHKPADLSFADAAALPVAGVTALQGLRDHAGLQPGQSVLINGAGGGVGTYAVQIAKAMGAEVTAVCGTHNVEIARGLGADHVIDYTSDDFVASGRRYDAILDNVGNRSLSDCRRVLTDEGVLVSVGGAKHRRWLGPIPRLVAAKLRFLFGGQRVVAFIAKETHDELLALAKMVEQGELRSVIDRTYPLADAAEAIRHLADGHARGKIVVSVLDEASDR